MVSGPYEWLASARSLLFVPGDRPERFDKAARAGADAVIVDLEDAVPEDRKAFAREAVAEWLGHGNRAVVRVNGARTRWFSADLDSVADAAAALMIPKAEDPGEWAAVGARPVVPLIETARGILNANGLLAAPGSVRAALGSVDLALELGVDPDDGSALLWARSSLVMAAAAVGAPAPIDGVTTRLRDRDRLVADVESAKRLGMTAKLCIHPEQIGAVHELLAPTEAEAAWARRVVAGAGSGASAVDGQMVDAPVLARARQVLARLRV